ncbi:hypothetical protein FRC00_003649 [Tulasnella sp. 408]|nr:hypothetical protein FRC00_003649 [Tulasnella sp. 408]
MIKGLEAAKKRIAELKATITIAKCRLEPAAYVQRVEKMNMPYAIKKLTKERDLFRARLEPAKQEYARKAAERKLVKQEWKEEQEQADGSADGPRCQVRARGERKALQKQPESAQHEADQGAIDAGL